MASTSKAKAVISECLPCFCRSCGMSREMATKVVEELIEQLEMDGEHVRVAALQWLFFYIGQEAGAAATQKLNQLPPPAAEEKK